MTKRERMVLFMIAATLLNILVTAVLFVGFIALYSLTLGRVVKAGSSAIAVSLSFILAVILSSLVYKKALTALRKKINFEEKFGIKS